MADLVPNCDLSNPLANGNPAAVNGGGGADFCGQISNLRFGQPVLTGNYDPDLLNGWGVRAGDWSLGVSVQQQIFPRMSIEVGYYRRSFDGFSVNDNLVADGKRPDTLHRHGAGGFTAPQRRRLLDRNPLRRRSDQVGADRQPGDPGRASTGRSTRYFNGFDVTVSLRTGAV